jgi:hypothetical protein
MSINQYLIVNFGVDRAGLATVGYQLYNSDGSTNGSRVVASQEIGGGSYGSVVVVPDNFNGRITWDSGEGTPVYASEQINLNQRVDLSQGVPVRDLTAITTQTLGDCLSAARAGEAGGMLITGNRLFLLGPNGETVRQFTLNDPSNPTARS